MIKLSQTESEIYNDLKMIATNNIVIGYGLDILAKLGRNANQRAHLSALVKKGCLKILAHSQHPRSFQPVPYKWEITNEEIKINQVEKSPITPIEKEILAKLHTIANNQYIISGFNKEIFNKIKQSPNRITYMKTLEQKGYIKTIEQRRTLIRNGIAPYKRQLLYALDNNNNLFPIEKLSFIDEKIKTTVYETIKNNSKNGIFTATKNALSRLVGVFYPAQKVTDALEALKDENKIIEEAIGDSDKFTWIVSEIRNEINYAFGEEQSDEKIEFESYSNDSLPEEDEKLVKEIIDSIRHNGLKYKMQNQTIEQQCQTIEQVREKNKSLELLVASLERQNTGLRKRIEQIQYEIMRAER